MIPCNLSLSSQLQKAARQMEAAPPKPKEVREYPEHKGALVLGDGLSTAGLAARPAQNKTLLSFWRPGLCGAHS